MNNRNGSSAFIRTYFSVIRLLLERCLRFYSFVSCWVTYSISVLCCWSSSLYFVLFVSPQCHVSILCCLSPPSVMSLFCVVCLPAVKCLYFRIVRLPAVTCLCFCVVPLPLVSFLIFCAVRLRLITCLLSVLFVSFQ